MDFVAEIVLAYSDTELAKRLKRQSMGAFISYDIGTTIAFS